ncbi:MAG: hypothetical protein HY746_08335 [Elusimicrobia bacterium]|nr:hypothetical protein [Elusimicrobiota bacterium]
MFASVIAFGILGIWKVIFAGASQSRDSEHKAGNKESLKEILEEIEKGNISVEDAVRKMKA